MDIVYHAHRATITPGMRLRTERGLRRLEHRLGRPIDGTVRFEEDGPDRRVEIVLHIPRSRRFVADAEGRFFGPALATALARLDAQLRHFKRTKKARARRLARV
jgi:ribosome-associated translation inhibitor RaiA